MLEAEIAIGEDAKHSQVRSIAVDRIPAGTVVRVDAVPTATRDRDVPLAADEPGRRHHRPRARLDPNDAYLRPLRGGKGAALRAGAGQDLRRRDRGTDPSV